MQAAVKGTLQFSSFQLVLGLVELHGEPDGWPAYEFRSRLVSFTWLICQENATLDARQRRLHEGALRRAGLLSVSVTLRLAESGYEALTAAWGMKRAPVLGSSPVVKGSVCFRAIRTALSFPGSGSVLGICK